MLGTALKPGGERVCLTFVTPKGIAKQRTARWRACQLRLSLVLATPSQLGTAVPDHVTLRSLEGGNYTPSSSVWITTRALRLGINFAFRPTVRYHRNPLLNCFVHTTMSFLSGMTLIRSLATFNLGLAYLFHTSPRTVASHPFVFIIGEAMGLPKATAFQVPSSTASFLAAVIVLLAFTDLSFASMPEEITSYVWSAQAPIRFFLFAAMAVYSYGSHLFSVAKSDTDGGTVSTAERGGIDNGVVFTWAFVQMVIWFWVSFLHHFSIYHSRQRHESIVVKE